MVISGSLATVVTLALPAFQAGGWVSEHAVWTLWVGIAALLIVIIFLVARLTAVKEDLVSAKEETVAAGEEAKKAALEAQADLEALRASVRQGQTPGLGSLDQGLADQLLEYSSDPNLLRTLGSFFPYRIPMEPVRRLEELAELPMTRSAHDEALSRHFSGLAESATQWLEKFTFVSSIEGDYYSTKLRETVPQEVYQRHAAMTDELGRAGFELHGKFLAYQKYYASLQRHPEA